MKVLIFCLVLGTVLKLNAAEEELPSGCPPEEDPNYPTHLPHDTDCGKFWKCYEGVPYLNHCGDGLEWSIPNSWCDYPENAKCVRPIPEDGDDSDEDGEETELPTGCPPDEDPLYPTHLPHASDCGKFWKCWNGVPYLNECPTGQHWSVGSNWCDYPENANCETVREVGGANGEKEDNEDLPTGCPPDEDPRYPTHLPHATDCDKFWKCNNGEPNLNYCEPGLEWSIPNNWCDYPENAKCVRPIPEDGGENGGGEESEEDSGEGGDTDLPTGCPPDEDPRYPTHLPHATDCDKFWKCYEGVPHLNQCEPGLEWSIPNSWCDYPENAQCVRPIPEDGGENGGGEESGEDSEEETDLPTGCPPDEDPRYPTHLPHETDCDKFWKCYEGVPHLNHCDPGLEWSIPNSWCDYPENAKCVRPIPEDGGENGGGEESGENGEEPPTDCPEDDASGTAHFPHATDCTKFWQCVEGKAYLNVCPSNLHWNIAEQLCDYPANANCVRPLEEAIPQVVQTSAGVPEGYSCPAEDDIDNPVHIPHATECSQFYKCYAGAPILQDCPGGLEWNIEANYCDYAWEANCARPLLDVTAGVAAGYNCPADDDIDNPVHLPHSTDCTKFYKCYNGGPIIQDCPGGLEWNIEANHCDYGWEANCVRPLLH